MKTEIFSRPCVRFLHALRTPPLRDHTRRLGLGQNSVPWPPRLPLEMPGRENKSTQFLSSCNVSRLMFRQLRDQVRICRSAIAPVRSLRSTSAYSASSVGEVTFDLHLDECEVRHRVLPVEPVDALSGSSVVGWQLVNAVQVGPVTVAVPPARLEILRARTRRVVVVVIIFRAELVSDVVRQRVTCKHALGT